MFLKGIGKRGVVAYDCLLLLSFQYFLVKVFDASVECGIIQAFSSSIEAIFFFMRDFTLGEGQCR